MAVFHVACCYRKKSGVRIEPWTFEYYTTTQSRKIGPPTGPPTGPPIGPSTFPPITIRERRSTFSNRGDLKFYGIYFTLYSLNLFM